MKIPLQLRISLGKALSKVPGKTLYCQNVEVSGWKSCIGYPEPGPADATFSIYVPDSTSTVN